MWWENRCAERYGWLNCATRSFPEDISLCVWYLGASTVRQQRFSISYFHTVHLWQYLKAAFIEKDCVLRRLEKIMILCVMEYFKLGSCLVLFTRKQKTQVLSLLSLLSMYSVFYWLLLIKDNIFESKTWNQLTNHWIVTYCMCSDFEKGLQAQVSEFFWVDRGWYWVLVS